MLLKSYQKGTPFIGEVFKIDRSVFRNQIKQAHLTSASNYSIVGHNGNLNLNHVIKSAMGEWIERLSLFYDRYLSQEFIPAVNLINGEIIEVEKGRIIFKEKEMFNDSCGVASHLVSKKVIRSSYYEFFERQSLIYNWITESKGTIIDYSDINHPIINHLIETNYKFIDELYLFDISLHKSIKVVLALGFGENYKTVGLNASFNSKQAIIGALEESIQTFAPNWTKGYINSFYTSENKRKNFDMYLQLYMDLTPQEFKRKYNYLINSEEKVKIVNYLEQSQEFSVNAMKRVADDLDLHPYCAFIPSFYDGLSTKIIKIFSPNGYPHMHPPFFSEEETSITFNKQNEKFPNAYMEIPFP
ncbi:YcaO-like family protein [Robertmurraya andreesenii]|uniref:YcaO domain-containing protein n=1 Tax=Anoxybacillus andreesenii TaxID=1325932 RepID=A0ABT9V6A7_9BACL|nr:YcaO-like family protein [Robertmurraya andreesenii]MDQ0156486.1 hypothetical protein [Robertmurraya andreesenii]